MSVAAVLGQDGREPAPIDRLGEVLRGAQREAHVLVVHDRQHHDRDLCQCGVCLERREHAPSVHSRHHDVQRDDVGPRVTGERDAGFTIGRRQHAIALLAQEPHHEIAHGRVVVYDEHRTGVAVAALAHQLRLLRLPLLLRAHGEPHRER